MKTDELNVSQIIKTPFSRREFIVNNLKMAGALTLGTYAVSFLNSCSDSSNPASPNNSNAEITVNIAEAANSNLQNIGGSIAIAGNDLDGKGILIIRKNETEFTALSRNCTHQGCTIPNFSDGISTCPCHGSKFNTTGGVVNGPAQSSLKSYAATLNGNIITITA